jgi:hypothetical protein
MKRKPPARTAAPASQQPAAIEAELLELETADDDGSESIVARPDGYHWLARDGIHEFGPFETLEDAQAAMQAATDDSEQEPAETLQEAELEIGIADWIDPETGAPAEGQSPPHLEVE